MVETPVYHVPAQRREVQSARGWMFMALGLFVVLFVVGLPAISYLRRQSAIKEASRQTIDSYMSAAAAQDPDEMYLLVAPGISRAQFTRDIDATLLNKPYIEDYKSVAVSTEHYVVEHGKAHIDVTGTISYNTAGTSRFRATLIGSEDSVTDMIVYDNPDASGFTASGADQQLRIVSLNVDPPQ